MMSKQGGKRQAGEEGGAAGEPITEKIAELVGRAIPEQLLPTFFVGLAGLALLLFILMILGFTRDPGEVAADQIDTLETRIEQLDTDLGKALREKKDAEREKGSSGGDLKRTKGLLERAEKQRDELQTRLQERTKQSEENRTSLRQTKAELDSAKVAAARERQTVEKERDKAVRALKVQTERQTTADTRYEDLKKKFDELRGQQGEDKKLYERAQKAFDTIVKTVDGIDDPEKKIEAIERLRTTHSADLTGTAFVQNVDRMVARERSRKEGEKRLAQKKAKRASKEAYADYMNKLKMATDHAGKTAVLTAAKTDFEEREESGFALKIDLQLKAEQAAHDDEVARSVHEEVMTAIAKGPKAYEENLARLKDAYEKVKDTRWDGALKKQIESRERTLADDVARALCDELESKARLNPKEFSVNLAFAGEVKPRISKRYEKLFAQKVAGIEAAKLEAEGREALSAARQHLAKNPKDYAGNVAALEEFLERAKGSRHEGGITKLLQRERSLLTRAGQ